VTAVLDWGGDTNSRDTPTQVGTDTDWDAVQAGLSYTVALKSDGSLWSWGSNSYGQLGLGDTVDRDTPTSVDDEADQNAMQVEYSLFTKD